MKITLDAVLRARGVTAKAIAEQIGVTETQLSHFRSGKVRGLRFSTLSKLCYVLSARPPNCWTTTAMRRTCSSAVKSRTRADVIS